MVGGAKHQAKRHSSSNNSKGSGDETQSNPQPRRRSRSGDSKGSGYARIASAQAAIRRMASNGTTDGTVVSSSFVTGRRSSGGVASSAAASGVAVAASSSAASGVAAAAVSTAAASNVTGLQSLGGVSTATTSLDLTGGDDDYLQTLVDEHYDYQPTSDDDYDGHDQSSVTQPQIIIGTSPSPATTSGDSISRASKTTNGKKKKKNKKPKKQIRTSTKQCKQQIVVILSIHFAIICDRSLPQEPLLHGTLCSWFPSSSFN